MRPALASTLVAVACSAFLTCPEPARAAEAPAAEVESLRKQIEALETKVLALEAASRTAQGEAEPPSAPPGATSETPPTASPSPASPSEPGAEPPALVPPPPPAPVGTPAPRPEGQGTTALSKVFNPDISAIGDFLGAAGKSPGGGEPSLELHEAEVGFQAVVDPYARADFFLTFGPNEVGVEEGYVTFPTRPGGLLVKAGKMRDAFGKVDGMHNHVLPTTDRPIVSRNLLGGEDALADSGISVARLIPIPGVFLEATGQVFRGESEVFKAPTRGDLAYVGHLRFYQDLSESWNLDLGGSVAYGHNGDDPSTTTRLVGVDGTFRYKPLRRAIYTHVLARAELVWSRRQAATTLIQNAFGAYGYLEYQLTRRWFAGVRYDYSERADNAALHDSGGSFVLTYWPSEFSQVRGQYRHTRFGEGRTADEFLFQLQFSIGAHGAHAF
jgi:hypothetical protein